MANKTKNPSNSSNSNNQDTNQQKGFQQGMGDNSTNSQTPSMKGEPDLSKSEDMKNRQQSGDQYKVTNQDQKITNSDMPVKNQGTEKMPVDDDGDRNSTSSQRNEPEIDTPQNEPERTEKKIPNM